jgi:hypothetical protein
MLRGVMADAECPRCGTTALPPEAGLVTCKQCALVYPPHEVLHKTSRSVEPDYPAPPPNVDAFIESDVLIVRWPLARYLGILMIAFAILLVVPAHELASWYARAPFVVVIVVALYAGVVQLLCFHQLAIASDAVTHHVPFAPVPSVRISREGMKTVVVSPTQLGGEIRVLNKSRRAPTRLARGTDRAALRYAAQLIATKLAVPLDDPPNLVNVMRPPGISGPT